MDNEFNQGQNRAATPPDASSTISAAATKMKDQVTQTAASAKETMAEAGRKAVDKMNEQRGPAASSLGGAASSLHEAANSVPAGVKSGVDSVANAAHATADKIQATADYVRNNDLNAMMGDVEGLVKRYPGQSLLAAAAVGFLVGRVFRNAG
jgi:ElaB/YqjD/DUF883 family membrane-anchored ribosome-binding protein